MRSEHRPAQGPQTDFAVCYNAAMAKGVCLGATWGWGLLWGWWVGGTWGLGATWGFQPMGFDKGRACDPYKCYSISCNILRKLEMQQPSKVLQMTSLDKSSLSSSGRPIWPSSGECVNSKGSASSCIANLLNGPAYHQHPSFGNQQNASDGHSPVSSTLSSSAKCICAEPSCTCNSRHQQGSLLKVES